MVSNEDMGFREQGRLVWNTLKDLWELSAEAQKPQGLWIFSNLSF